MAGCNNPTTNNPPDTPTGLVAIPGNRQVELRWNANTEPDLEGYTIYWGSDLGSLSNVENVPKSATSKTIASLTNGTTYFFVLEAKDTGGLKSAKTNEVAATPFEPDIVAPQIVTTVPTSGATLIALDSNLQINFSETMDVGTVTVTIAPGFDLGDPTWNPGNTQLSFNPATSLASETTYTVTVEGQDPAGNPLAGSKTFSFTTVGSPPTVLSTAPANGDTNIPVNTDITFIFSEAMDRASVEGAFSSTPSIACAWSWTSDNRLAICNPATDLSFNTNYSVTLGTGAQDQVGNLMTAAYGFSFQTANAPDTTKPTVTAHVPANEAIGVPSDMWIEVTFSEPMDKASTQTAFQILSPSGVAGIFAWASSNRMFFLPSNRFAYGTFVTWQVTDAAKDLAGNTLAASVTRSYRVIREKTVDLVSQAGLDGYVFNTGSVQTSGGLMVGDTNANTYMRGFLSFNLGPLVSDGATTITAATLYVYQYAVTSGAYTDLGGRVLAESVYYGPSLDSADFETPVLIHSANITTLSDSPSIGWKSAFVFAKVVNDYLNRGSRANRSQFRLRFPTNTNVDGQPDVAFFNSAADVFNKPYLRITYLYP
jgi:fibronectin type 3 domain-containing protein